MTRISDPRDQEYVEVEVTVYAVSLKAVLMANRDHDEADAVWIAKSQIQTGGVLQKGRDYTIGMKRWLAEKEGFDYVD